MYSCTGHISDPQYSSEGDKFPGISPKIEIDSLKTKEYIKGGSVYNFKFKVTDPIGVNSSKLEYSRDGGSTWQPMLSATNQDGVNFPTTSGEYYIYNWAVPQEPSCQVAQLASDSSQFVVRVTSSGRPDAEKAVLSTVAQATVDSCSPTLSANSFSVGIKQKGFINFSLSNINDAFLLSPIKSICIKMANIAPTINDSCWTSLPALRTVQSPTVANVNIPFFLGFAASTNDFYIWASDFAGNISEMTATASKDILSSVSRNCPSECSLSINSVTMTANVTTVGSGYIDKTDSPAGPVMSDPKYFVVTSNGLFIYRDAISNSIKMINLQQDTAPSTLVANSATIVDGNQSVATVKAPARLAMDSDENLYIYDYDRIRKLTFITNTTYNLQTIVGSGVSTDSSIQNALDLKIEAADRTTSVGSNMYWYSTFEVLNDGRIYFSSANPLTSAASLRIYNGSNSSQISSLSLTGLGVSGDSQIDTTALYLYSNVGMQFDSITNQLTNLVSRFCLNSAACTTQYSSTFLAPNGQTVGSAYQLNLPSIWSNGQYFNSSIKQLYHLNAYTGAVFKLNTINNSWDRILGTTVYPSSFCNDSTSANSCAVRLWDSQVLQNDRLFFIDQGRLRFVDADGRVKTIIKETP